MCKLKGFLVCTFILVSVLFTSGNEVRAQEKRSEVFRDEYSITYETSKGYESEYSNVPISLKDDQGNWQSNDNNFEEKENNSYLNGFYQVEYVDNNKLVIITPNKQKLELTLLNAKAINKEITNDNVKITFKDYYVIIESDEELVIDVSNYDVVISDNSFSLKKNGIVEFEIEKDQAKLTDDKIIVESLSKFRVLVNVKKSSKTKAINTIVPNLHHNVVKTYKPNESAYDQDSWINIGGYENRDTNTKIGYVRGIMVFDKPTINSAYGDVVSAKLQMHIAHNENDRKQNASKYTLKARAYMNIENLTWDNQPSMSKSYGNPAYSNTGSLDLGSHEYDISSYIKGANKETFGFYGPEDASYDGLAYSSTYSRIIILQQQDQCSQVSIDNPLPNDSTWKCKVNEIFEEEIIRKEIINKLNLSDGNQYIRQVDINEIVSLNFKDKGIFMPDELGKVYFNSLTSLDLSNNNLSTNYPFIDRMINLKEINLEKNNYNVIPDDIFNKSINTKLTTIKVGNNHLVSLFSTWKDFSQVEYYNQEKEFPIRISEEKKEYLFKNIPKIYSQLSNKNLNITLNKADANYSIENNDLIINIDKLNGDYKVNIRIIEGSNIVGNYHFDLVIDSELMKNMNEYEFIVALKDNMIGIKKSTAVQRANLEVIDIEPLEYGESIENTKLSSQYMYLYKIKTLKSKNEVIDNLKRTQDYSLVEENEYVNIAKAPTINLGTSKNSYQIKNTKANYSWPYEKNGVRVGVLDSYLAGGKTGSRHVDLKNRVSGFMYVNPGDDRCKTSVHGDHVTGIIAANHNKFGVSGISKKSKIYFSSIGNKDCKSGTDSYLKGISWAVKANKAKVINISYGALAEGKSDFYKKMKKAYLHYNTLFIISASNEGENLSNKVCSPHTSNVMCVGASTNKDKKASFSNYHESWVDIFAPGADIRSLNGKKNYVYKSGTSMAAPVTTGVASQLFSRNTKANPNVIKDIMMNNGKTMKKAKNGKTLSLSNRIVNSWDSMKYYKVKRVVYPLKKNSTKVHSDAKYYLNKNKTVLYATGKNTHKKLTNAKGSTKYKNKKKIFSVSKKSQIIRVYTTKYNTFIIIKNKKSGEHSLYAKGSNKWKQMGYVSKKKMHQTFYKVDLKRSFTKKMKIDAITFTTNKSTFNVGMVNIHFISNTTNNNYTLILGTSNKSDAKHRVLFEHENFGNYNAMNTRVVKTRYLFDSKGKYKVVKYHDSEESEIK